MKKIVYIALLFLGNVLYYGQGNNSTPESLTRTASTSTGGRVGIETDNPQQTLDVNGSMRVSQLGTAEHGSIPLSWDPTTKQVLKGSDEGAKSPFYFASYRIEMSRAGSDYANEIDLGIDANRYVAVLTQAYLVKKGINFADPTGAQVFITALTRRPDGNGTKVVKVKNGYFYDEAGSKVFPNELSNLNPLPLFLGVPQQETKIYKKEDNKYYFFGDFRDAKPVGGSQNYVWIVNALIINKEWVKTEGY